MPFEIVRNDITRMSVDAIVNAANNSLLGGGGVDGAIHCAAGPELLEECKTLGGCETGKAKITKGYQLPCKYVIHTVGPIWQGGNQNEKGDLASCYASSLRLAADYQCESIAFPLISSGAYGFPKDEALKIATEAIRDFLLSHDMSVYLVIFDRASFTLGKKLYAHIQAFIDDLYVAPFYEEAERSRQLNDMMRPVQATTASVPLLRPKTKLSRKKAEKETVDTFPDNLLMEACSAGPSLEDYLKRMDEGFQAMLIRKIDECGMTDAECYKRANIDRKLFNKIKNQADYKPSKNTVLAFAISLKLSLAETENMLRKAGFSLSHSSKFDLIVEFFISQGNYDIFEINEALFSFDQKLLGSVM